MHAHGSKQVGIATPHDVGHGATGGQSGDIHARRIDAFLSHDRLRQRRQHGGLAVTAPLMLGLEPVPALLCVGMLRLLRIQHDKTLLARQCVHLRAGCEVARVLGAAVQHQHQWPGRGRCAGRARWHVQLVGERAPLVVEAAIGPALGLAFERQLGAGRFDIGHVVVGLVVEPADRGGGGRGAGRFVDEASVTVDHDA